MLDGVTSGSLGVASIDGCGDLAMTATHGEHVVDRVRTCGGRDQEVAPVPVSPRRADDLGRSGHVVDAPVHCPIESEVLGHRQPAGPDSGVHLGDGRLQTLVALMVGAFRRHLRREPFDACEDTIEVDDGRGIRTGYAHADLRHDFDESLLTESLERLGDRLSARPEFLGEVDDHQGVSGCVGTVHEILLDAPVDQVPLVQRRRLLGRCGQAVGGKGHSEDPSPRDLGPARPSALRTRAWVFVDESKLTY